LEVKSPQVVIGLVFTFWDFFIGSDAKRSISLWSYNYFMNTKTKTIIMEKARAYINTGWHCSEGILLAVGKHYLGEINPGALRISTAFAGSFMGV